MSGWGLALDFGSTFSTAATVTGNRVTVIDVFSSSRLPSVVLFDENGELVVGAAAENAAVLTPERVERSPKRAVGNRMLLLGGEAVLVVDVVAALLTVLVDEAVRQHGGEPPTRTILTHPARWGPDRLAVLLDAAVKAGLDRESVQLVSEPVAAAALYSKARALRGDAVAVYDLGGGTFDTAVLRQTAAGFEVVGVPEGDETVGGEAFDHLLYRKVGEHLAAEDAGLWVDLTTSPERRWRRANADLLTQVRKAKEQLSTTERANVYVPVADRLISVTRSEFESLVADDVQRTAELLTRTVDGAGLSTSDVAAVYLVGGSSRIPLIGRRLTETFTGRLATWDDPQLAVVLGAAELLRHDAAEPMQAASAATVTPGVVVTVDDLVDDPATAAATEPATLADASAPGGPDVSEASTTVVPPERGSGEQADRSDDPSRGRRARVLIALGAAAAILAGLVVAGLAVFGDDDGSSAGPPTVEPTIVPPVSTTPGTDVPPTDPVEVVGSPEWESMVRGLSLCEALDRDDDLPRFVRSNAAADACAAGAAGANGLSLCDAIYEDGELRTTESGPTSKAIVEACPEPEIAAPDVPTVGSDEWAADVRSLDMCAIFERDDISDLVDDSSSLPGLSDRIDCQLGHDTEVTDQSLCEWLADQSGVADVLVEACAGEERPGPQGPTGPGGADS